ncbi:MAG: hypothetical protein WD116_02795 [Chloroflexota bacterium]
MSNGSGRVPLSLATACLAVVATLSGCSLLVNDPASRAPHVGSPATWELDPGDPFPVPSDRSFAALVTERACASGREIEGLLLPPVIEYDPNEVIVSLYLEPLAGGAQDCQGTAPTRFVIQLAEPLGDRRLVDGIGGEDR